ncbi:hypothetical protein ILYODFUR_014605 [Ilyodon furcidens]|uniref:Uncharacterized protein n=1 Tax=Ilyodon furcidens TaxID=33524 RepID=A0ABV0U9B3_9TELE
MVSGESGSGSSQPGNFQSSASGRCVWKILPGEILGARLVRNEATGVSLGNLQVVAGSVHTEANTRATRCWLLPA